MNLKKIHLILFLKPCYKWNTFNTSNTSPDFPPIRASFKPCSNWNTFNT